MNATQRAAIRSVLFYFQTELMQRIIYSVKYLSGMIVLKGAAANGAELPHYLHRRSL
jgi:hypothetical protein